jgi:hypothetical protein
MRKSTLFISAALTTFMLAVMFGVASAYQKAVQAADPTEVAVQQQQAQPTDVIPATATNIAGGAFTAEQAANLASNVIGRTDLYTAEIAQLDGVDTYLVTFSSGDIVYVSMNGQILSISKLPVTVILAPSTSVGNNNHQNNNNGGGTVVNPPPPSGSGGGDDDHGGDDDEGDDD